MNLASTLPLLAAAALLAGCAARPHAHDMEMEHGAGMDMQSMCAMHKRMMAGMTPAQQQAHMEEHMKSMSPEMRQRMLAMHEQCK